MVTKTIRRLEVRWKETVVGYMEKPNITPNLHAGKWVPLDKLETEAFLESLGRGQTEPVILQGRAGTVSSRPGERIEVNFSE